MTKKIWIPLAVALADAAWAYSALNVPPGGNEASTVSMINASIWIFLHVPAAMLGSQFFETGLLMTAAELFSIGALGALQMTLLAWLLLRYLQKKKKA